MENLPADCARMPTDAMENSGNRKRSAIIYCCLAFAVSWSLWVAAEKSGETPMTISVLFLHFHFSQKLVLVVLGNVAPGLIAVVMALLNEEKPFRIFLAQFCPTKSLGGLYIFAIFAPLAINLAMFMAQENLRMSAFANLRLGDFVRLFGVNILLAPLWEEIGWRGFLLPTLSKQTGLGRAALIVGFIWGGWHFVLYHSVLRASLYSFLISFGAIVAISVVLAVLYASSGNTLLLPILFHTSWNASTMWVVGVEPRYGLGPIVLQAVAVWLLAGIAWVCYRRSQDKIGLSSP
jgi:membrane protease YdiL (CAAX protease family)